MDDNTTAPPISWLTCFFINKVIENAYQVWYNHQMGARDVKVSPEVNTTEENTGVPATPVGLGAKKWLIINFVGCFLLLFVSLVKAVFVYILGTQYRDEKYGYEETKEEALPASLYRLYLFFFLIFTVLLVLLVL